MPPRLSGLVVMHGIDFMIRSETTMRGRSPVRSRSEVICLLVSLWATGMSVVLYSVYASTGASMAATHSLWAVAGALVGVLSGILFRSMRNALVGAVALCLAGVMSFVVII